MKETKKVTAASHLLGFAVTFAISVYSVSNLMSLILEAATRRLTVADNTSIVVYMLVGFASICVLARTIYRLDKKAGRIRNRIGWFE